MRIYELATSLGMKTPAVLEVAQTCIPRGDEPRRSAQMLTTEEEKILREALGHSDIQPNGGGQSMHNSNTAPRVPAGALDDASIDAESKRMWERGPALQAEFGTIEVWSAYHKADRRGKVKAMRRVVQESANV